MLQSVDNITALYVERVREMLGENKSAVVVMDNFKGQIVDSDLRISTFLYVYYHPKPQIAYNH